MNSREWIANIRDNGGQLGVFDSYKLGQTISSGGFSKIYLASRDGYRYAMKVPQLVDLDEGESISIDSRTFAQFKEEAQRWSLISNVVPDDVVCLLDFGYDPFPWMVMEFAEDTFANALESGRATMDDFKSILDSLQRIHNVRMNHLDIKPENILMVDGRWKFSDFGLSTMGQTGPGDGSIRGTPEYMAPEQVDPEKRSACDGRTDIWQMGIVLYRMVTGHDPYPSKGYSEIMMAIHDGGPDTNEIAEPYRSIIRKALAADMDSRYRTPREMREALDETGCAFLSLEPSAVEHSEMLDRAISLYCGYEEYDAREAYRLFETEGSAIATAFRAFMLRYGDGAPRNPVAAQDCAVSALPELSSLAKADPAASWLLGEFYLAGLGVDVDKEYGFVNIKRAADAGFGPAVYGLGQSYDDGIGTPKDKRKALSCYMRAAEAGYAIAQFSLANEYLSGQNLDKDEARGMELISDSARKGEPSSCAFLGLMYCLGGHVERDERRGSKLLMEAYMKGVSLPEFKVFKGPIIRRENTRGEDFYVALMLDGVSEIEDEAFASQSKMAVAILPNTLRRIGAGAFRNSGLRSIHVPDSVTSIGHGAFSSCGELDEITIGSGVTVIESDTFKQSRVGEIPLPGSVREIKSNAFQGSDIRSISMPGIELIGDEAFSGCKSLESVDLGDRPVVVSQRSFDNCTKLSDMRFDPITDIGYAGFRSCSSLVSVELPRIRNLGIESFFGCSNLSSLVLGPDVVKIGYKAFRDTKVSKLVVPDSFVVEAGMDYGAPTTIADRTESVWDGGTTDGSVFERLLSEAGFPETFNEGMRFYSGINENHSYYDALNAFSAGDDIASRIMVAWMRYTGRGTYKVEGAIGSISGDQRVRTDLGDDPVSDWLRFILMSMNCPGISGSRLTYVRRSAEGGFPLGEHQYGVSFVYAIDVPVDKTEGAKWLAKAASHGSVDAMSLLGYIYENGEGVPQDYGKAMSLYTMVSERGVPYGEYKIGCMYDKGLGVPKSDTEASKHYHAAADRGDGEALNKLYSTGSCYIKMLESPDESMVRRLIEASGSNSYGANAKYALGMAYEFGIGVQKSEAESNAWYGDCSRNRVAVSSELEHYREHLLEERAAQQPPKQEEEKKHRWFGR